MYIYIYIYLYIQYILRKNIIIWVSEFGPINIMRIHQTYSSNLFFKLNKIYKFYQTNLRMIKECINNTPRYKKRKPQLFFRKYICMKLKPDKIEIRLLAAEPHKCVDLLGKLFGNMYTQVFIFIK